MQYQQAEIQEVAQSILNKVSSKILCFYGEMGAGKTTLIKALVAELGSSDEASSPTFGIVNEYHFEDGSILGYHFDFYRLNDETEALDLGFEDYLNQDVWIFIEWPEKIPSFLPKDKHQLKIEILNSVTRTISIH